MCANYAHERFVYIYIYILVLQEDVLVSIEVM